MGVEFLLPELSAGIPLMEGVQVHVLVGGSVVGMDGTSDENTFGASSLSLPKTVNVTNSGDNLVRVLDMRIVFLQLNGGLLFVLDSNDERFVNAGSFLHELLGSTDSVVIG